MKPATLLEGVCGSGDCFITDHLSTDYDVIDMEAYPIAWVAQHEKIPFLCLKYITDGADGSAALEWQSTIKRAAAALKKVITALEQATE